VALGLGVAVAFSVVTVAATTSPAFADAQMTLTVSGSLSGVGIVQVPVTFTYHDANVGTDPISNVVVSSRDCSPVVFVSGDTNNNDILDPGETWTFTCTVVATRPGIYTDVAVATGTDAVDGLPVPPDQEATDVNLFLPPPPHVIETVTPTTGVAPLPVTFTTTVTNGDPQPFTDVVVSSYGCSPLVLVSGDTTNNDILEPGETRVYTCTTVFDRPGTYDVTAFVTGTDTVDGLPPVGDQSEASVVVTGPDNDLAFTNVPSNITVDASGPMGTTVNYTPPTVVDEDTPTPAVMCDPAPGSTFAIGTTTVTCSIAGNTDDKTSAAQATFTVTVNGAGTQVTALAGNVQTLPPVGTSLNAKLQTTTQQLQAGNVHAACNTLMAVINEASAQTGRHLTVDQANQVIAQTEQIAAVLAC
jgi:hypothetical protein